MQADGQTYGCQWRQTDVQKHRQTDNKMDEQMQKDGQTYGWQDRQTNGKNKCMNTQTYNHQER